MSTPATIRHSAPPPHIKTVRVMELGRPDAFAWYTLDSPPTELADGVLGLLGLAVVAYVAVSVLKTLGRCWSAKIKGPLHYVRVGSADPLGRL
jgi:hypothetical protein